MYEGLRAGLGVGVWATRAAVTAPARFACIVTHCQSAATPSSDYQNVTTAWRAVTRETGLLG
jgi:hypothetical protein